MRAGTLAVATAALLLPAAPAQRTDSALCGFPLQVTVALESPRHAQTDALKFTFAGPARMTLRNAATGRTAVLDSSGSQSVDTSTGTIAFGAPQVWRWSSTGIPFARTGGGRLRAPRYVLESAPGNAIDPCALVGGPPPAARRTPAPWPLPTHTLSLIGRASLVPVIGAVIRHEHAHLTVTVNGRNVTVPAGIGLAEPAATAHGVFARVANSPLHTHDPDGLIHIESDRSRAFTLGQFFDEWGVRFDARCLGSYCSGGGKTLRVLVDGKSAPDPRGVVLRDHEQISVRFG